MQKSSQNPELIFNFPSKSRPNRSEIRMMSNSVKEPKKEKRKFYNDRRMLKDFKEYQSIPFHVQQSSTVMTRMKSLKISKKPRWGHLKVSFTSLEATLSWNHQNASRFVIRFSLEEKVEVDFWQSKHRVPVRYQRIWTIQIMVTFSMIVIVIQWSVEWWPKYIECVTLRITRSCRTSTWSHGKLGENIIQNSCFLIVLCRLTDSIE